MKKIKLKYQVNLNFISAIGLKHLINEWSDMFNGELFKVNY